MFVRSVLISFVCLLVSVNCVQWLGGSGDFSTSIDWAGNLLPFNSSAEIQASGTYTVTISLPTTVLGDLILGNASNKDSKPTLMVNSNIAVIIGGTITLMSGTIHLSSGASLTASGLIINATDTVVIEVDSNGLLKITTVTVNEGQLIVNGTGVFDLTSTTFSVEAGLSPIIASAVTVSTSSAFETADNSMVVFMGEFEVTSALVTSGIFEFGAGSSISGSAEVKFENYVTFDATSGNSITISSPVSFDFNVSLISGTLIFESTFIVNLVFSLSSGTLVQAIGQNVSISLGNGGTIYAIGSASVESNVNVDSDSNFSAASGVVLSYTGTTVITTTGTLNIQGSVDVYGSINITGAGALALATDSILTIESASLVVLTGTNLNQITGTGLLNITIGGSIISDYTAAITTNVNINGVVQVQTGTTLSFNGASTTIMTSVFNGWSGFTGIVTFNSTTTSISGTVMLNNLTCVTATGKTTQWTSGQSGSLTFSNAYWLVLGTFSVEANTTPVLFNSVSGTSSWFAINATGSFQTSQTVQFNVIFNDMGSVNVLSGGHIIVSGNGSCSNSATITDNGIFEIDSVWQLGTCNVVGNGSLLFNVTSSFMNFTLTETSYTLSKIQVAGKSLLWIGTSSINSTATTTISGSLAIQDWASVVILSNVVISGNITTSNNSTLWIKGTSILKTTTATLGATANFIIEWVNIMSSQLSATGNVAINGNLYVWITGNSPNQITIMTYGSSSGQFSHSQYNLTSGICGNCNYTNTYNSTQMYATKQVPSTTQGTTPTTGSMSSSTTTSKTSTTSTGSTGFTSSSSKTSDSSTFVPSAILILASSLFSIFSM